MTISLAIMIVAICGSYVGISIIHLFNQKRAVSVIAKVVLGIYMCCLVVLTLLTASSFSANGLSIYKVTDAPWFGKDILLTFANVSKSDAITNLIMFYPMGYLISLLCKGSTKTKFLKGFVISILASFIIEFLQFALPILRAPSLSDLIFNSLSGLVGASAFVVIEKVFKKNKE